MIMRGRFSGWCVIPTLTAVLGGCVTAPSLPPQTPRLPPPVIGKPVIDPGHPPAMPRPSAGNPPFYDVMGERYTVMASGAGYAEHGIASWYGREFHGRRTSSGEVYDMYAMTAAHKTLPLPTTARVTSLVTGKSIVVRINDRGPFKKGRLIDLSYGAARELGFLNAGTAMVSIEALEGTGAPAPTARGPAARMYVQVGAFGQQANADALKSRLQRQGIDNIVIRYDARSQPAMYRVRIGPVASPAEFDAVVARVDRLDIRTPQLVVETPGEDSVPPPSASGMPGG